MNVYPEDVIKAAENLLDNRDFSVLLEYKLRDLQQQVMLSTEQTQILEAHTEYLNIKEFAEWIQMLGGR